MLGIVGTIDAIIVAFACIALLVSVFVRRAFACSLILGASHCGVAAATGRIPALAIGVLAILSVLAVVTILRWALHGRLEP